MKWQDGTVRWFDNRSGEGFIRVGEKSIYVHWSALVDGLKNKPRNAHKLPKMVWCVLFRGQKVRVKVIEDYSFVQISEVK